LVERSTTNPVVFPVGPIHLTRTAVLDCGSALMVDGGFGTVVEFSASALPADLEYPPSFFARTRYQ
jgi:hypothetical protein